MTKEALDKMVTLVRDLDELDVGLFLGMLIGRLLDEHEIADVKLILCGVVDAQEQQRAPTQH